MAAAAQEVAKQTTTTALEERNQTVTTAETQGKTDSRGCCGNLLVDLLESAENASFHRVIGCLLAL